MVVWLKRASEVLQLLLLRQIRVVDSGRPAAQQGYSTLCLGGGGSTAWCQG